MTVALRAEISQEEYAQIRVAALTAGVSTQEYVGGLLRRALGVEAERWRQEPDATLAAGALETERGEVQRLVEPVAAERVREVPDLAPAGLPPRSVSDVPVKPWKEMDRLERKAEIARQLEEHDGKD